MRKKYAPVRVKNPSSKNALVRLLQGQQLNLVFDKPEYANCKIDIAGSLLEVEDIEQIKSGWSATISQKTEVDSECPLFLGEVRLFDGKDHNNASLCVVAAGQKNDYLRIVNPSNQALTLQPNQVLEVVIQCADMHERWDAYPGGHEMVLEEIQHVVRSGCSLGQNDCAIEHVFRFRFDEASIQYLAGKPYAKYDGGTIHLSSLSRHSTISVTCVWRGRSSIYKALLLPKIPSAKEHLYLRSRTKKQVQEAKVALEKMQFTSLETGCNVLISR